ncbi:hypothetical protein ACIRH0_42030 [Streptomyces sp. NPDC093675]|uniref:hypothetical protein n=1 Tax=Streptomyces sp. NPDC093675 TaxID=3366049 RepID=UPI00380F57E7
MFNDEEKKAYLFTMGEIPPSADEDLAYLSASAYAELSNGVTSLSQLIQESLAGASGALPPSVSDQYVAAMNSLISDGGVNSLEDFAEQLGLIQSGRVKTSMDITEMKWQLIAEIVLLLVTLMIIAALSFFSGGAAAGESTLAVVRTRLAILTALQQFLKKTHLAPSLSEALEEAFTTFAVRLAMIAGGPKGRRPHGFDVVQLIQDGIVGGLMGGFHQLFHGAGDKFLKSAFGKGGGKSPFGDKFNSPSGQDTPSGKNELLGPDSGKKTSGPSGGHGDVPGGGKLGKEDSPVPSGTSGSAGGFDWGSPKGASYKATKEGLDFLASGLSENLAEMLVQGAFTGRWNWNWTTFAGSGTSDKFSNTLSGTTANSALTLKSILRGGPPKPNAQNRSQNEGSGKSPGTGSPSEEPEGTSTPPATGGARETRSQGPVGQPAAKHTGAEFPSPDSPSPAQDLPSPFQVPPTVSTGTAPAQDPGPGYEHQSGFGADPTPIGTGRGLPATSNGPTPHGVPVSNDASLPEQAQDSGGAPTPRSGGSDPAPEASLVGAHESGRVPTGHGGLGGQEQNGPGTAGAPAGTTTALTAPDSLSAANGSPTGHNTYTPANASTAPHSSAGTAAPQEPPPSILPHMPMHGTGSTAFSQQQPHAGTAMPGTGATPSGEPAAGTPPPQTPLHPGAVQDATGGQPTAQAPVPAQDHPATRQHAPGPAHSDAAAAQPLDTVSSDRPTTTTDTPPTPHARSGGSPHHRPPEAAPFGPATGRTTQSDGFPSPEQAHIGRQYPLTSNPAHEQSIATQHTPRHSDAMQPPLLQAAEGSVSGSVFSVLSPSAERRTLQVASRDTSAPTTEARVQQTPDALEPTPAPEALEMTPPSGASTSAAAKSLKTVSTGKRNEDASPSDQTATQSETDQAGRPFSSPITDSQAAGHPVITETSSLAPGPSATQNGSEDVPRAQPDTGRGQDTGALTTSNETDAAERAGTGETPLPSPAQLPAEHQASPAPRGSRDTRPRFVVRSSFDARRFTYAGQTVTDLTVRLAMRGPEDQATRVRSQLDAGVSEFLNTPAWRLPNGDRFHVTVEPVDPSDAPHLIVDLVARDQAAMDQNTWWTDAEPVQLAHELTHQLGLRDEYRDTDAPHRPHIPGSLLGSLDQSPEQPGLTAGGLRGRHMALLSALIGDIDTHHALHDGDRSWNAARSAAVPVVRQHTWVDPVSRPLSDGDVAPRADLESPFADVVRTPILFGDGRLAGVASYDQADWDGVGNSLGYLGSLTRVLDVSRNSRGTLTVHSRAPVPWGVAADPSDPREVPFFFITHGSRTHMQVTRTDGSYRNLGEDEAAELVHSLTGRLSRGRPIVLLSCFVGLPTGHEDSIIQISLGQVVANRTRKAVFAPAAEAGVGRDGEGFLLFRTAQGHRNVLLKFIPEPGEQTLEDWALDAGLVGPSGVPSAVNTHYVLRLLRLMKTTIHLDVQGDPRFLPMLRNMAYLDRLRGESPAFSRGLLTPRMIRDLTRHVLGVPDANASLVRLLLRYVETFRNNAQPSHTFNDFAERSRQTHANHINQAAVPPHAPVPRGEQTPARLQHTGGQASPDEHETGSVPPEGGNAAPAPGGGGPTAPTNLLSGGPRFVVRSAFDVRRFLAPGGPVADLTVRVTVLGDSNGRGHEGLWDRLRQGVDKFFNAPRHTLPDTGERLHVTVERVAADANPHLSVAVVPRDQPMDQRSWWADAGPEAYAHELAHQLGLRDEYAESGAEHRPDVPGSLLGRFRQPPLDGSPVLGLRGRHLELLSALVGAPDPGTMRPGGAAAPFDEARSAAVPVVRQHTWVDPVSRPLSDGDVAPRADLESPFADVVRTPILFGDGRLAGVASYDQADWDGVGNSLGYLGSLTRVLDVSRNSRGTLTVHSRAPVPWGVAADPSDPREVPFFFITHGSRTHMQVTRTDGSYRNLGEDEAAELVHSLTGRLSRGRPIVLLSCFVGLPTGHEDSIIQISLGQVVANRTRKAVFAPAAEAGVGRDGEGFLLFRTAQGHRNVLLKFIPEPGEQTLEDWALDAGLVGPSGVPSAVNTHYVLRLLRLMKTTIHLDVQGDPRFLPMLRNMAYLDRLRGESPAFSRGLLTPRMIRDLTRHVLGVPDANASLVRLLLRYVETFRNNAQPSHTFNDFAERSRQTHANHINQAAAGG